MKKSFKTISIALAGMMTAGLFAACGEPEKAEKTAASLVCVDVNPSVSFVLDEEDKVLSVIAENEDAQVLVYEENFEGLTVEKAVEKLADLAVELGYLHEGNRGVNVTAEGSVNADDLKASLQTAFSAAVEEAGGEFEITLTSEGLFSTQRELAEINEAYQLDLTVSEYELILQAQAADKTLTVEAAAKLTTEDLLAIVYDGVEEYIPYATQAYTQMKNEAFSVYYKAKEELLNTCWSLPYLNVLKYPSLNGFVYSTYSAASITLETGIYAAELAAKVAKATPIPKTVTDGIAVSLGIAEESAKAEFDQAILGEEGKVTLASLEGYLNSYFKNMTAEERETAKEAFNEVMAAAKSAATEVYAAIDDEYKAAFEEMIEAMENAVPEQLKTMAQGVLAEFKATVEEMRTSMNGKEPLPAAYAALEKLEEAKAELLEKMKKELEQGGDLEKVEQKIADAEELFAGFEKTMNDKIAKAETAAKNYLAELKAQRKTQAQE